jgi:hypothetical protein
LVGVAPSTPPRQPLNILLDEVDDEVGDNV